MAESQKTNVALTGRLYEDELQRHKERMHEIASLHAQLQALEQYTALFEAAGIVISPREIMGAVEGESIFMGVGAEGRNERIVQVLLEQGLQVSEEESIGLKHGRFVRVKGDVLDLQLYVSNWEGGVKP